MQSAHVSLSSAACDWFACDCVNVKPARVLNNSSAKLAEDMAAILHQKRCNILHNDAGLSGHRSYATVITASAL